MPLNKDSILLLPPRFMAAVPYYAAMTAFSRVIIDTSMPFNKRDKSTHRTTILDANGEATVTIPIEKPRSMSRALWSDINVSAHGSWWNVAVTALQSAYGRTPYFEYYIDDFLPMLSSDSVGKPLVDLDCALDRLIRRLMLMTETTVYYGNPQQILAENAIEAPLIDYRTRSIDFTVPTEYYQLRASRHGFQPDMTIADLLFNMGPESILILHRMLP